MLQFTMKLVKSSLGGELYFTREMIDHMSLLREFYEPSMDLSPGMAG